MKVDLFDTHCHLTFDSLAAEVDRVITDATTAGVVGMLTVACRADDVENAVRLRTLSDRVHVAAGIHPHEAAEIDDAELRQLADHWHRPEVIAAGEMGLDFHYDFSPRETQQTVFRKQLDLAAETGLPIIVHAREAHDRVIQILCNHGYEDRPVVFHCFSGSAEQAAELRSHGWWTSFTGVITFKNAGESLQACVETPIDQLLFETDAPYLTPEPIRKVRPNEPQYVEHTIRFAAEARGESFESLAAATTRNARRFFRLDAQHDP
jgi:TatD DNase family protein